MFLSLKNNVDVLVICNKVIEESYISYLILKYEMTPYHILVRKVIAL